MNSFLNIILGFGNVQNEGNILKVDASITLGTNMPYYLLKENIFAPQQ